LASSFIQEAKVPEHSIPILHGKPFLNFIVAHSQFRQTARDAFFVCSRDEIFFKFFLRLGHFCLAQNFFLKPRFAFASTFHVLFQQFSRQQCLAVPPPVGTVE
jgi:hypothetical protein